MCICACVSVRLCVCVCVRSTVCYARPKPRNLFVYIGRGRGEIGSWIWAFLKLGSLDFEEIIDWILDFQNRLDLDFARFYLEC